MTPRSMRAQTKLIKKIASSTTLVPTVPKKFTNGVVKMTYIRSEGKTIMLIRLSSHIWRVMHEYVAYSIEGNDKVIIFRNEYKAKLYGNWREANIDYLRRCK